MADAGVEGHGQAADRPAPARQGDASQRTRRRQGPARRGRHRVACAAGASAADRRAHTDRDHGRRRQRRRQDDDDRQAHAPPRAGGLQGPAGRRRHLSRRGARTARGLGRPQPGRGDQPGRWRPGGGDLRCGHGRPLARARRGHRRHRRSSADAASPDGRAEEDPPRHRQGDAGCAARGAAGGGRQHGPERAGAGQGLRCRARTDRARGDQARRHRQGRRARRDRAAGAPRAGGRCRSTSSASAKGSKTCSRSRRQSLRRRC